MEAPPAEAVCAAGGVPRPSPAASGAPFTQVQERPGMEAPCRVFVHWAVCLLLASPKLILRPRIDTQKWRSAKVT